MICNQKQRNIDNDSKEVKRSKKIFEESRNFRMRISKIDV